MTLKITLATGNNHKVDEINLIARNYNIEFVLPEGEFNPVEDGETFLENAYCKVRHASKNGSTDLYLADDSGLCVEFLNGAPGIKSARYAPSAKERIEKLLKELEGTKKRKAKFVCAMVICNKKGEILFQTQKECRGSILKKEKGSGGFGYDPIFFVDSIQKGMAELTKEEKSKVSHRAQALNEVLNWLKDRII